MQAKHILCPIDFSASSQAALVFATSLAKDNQAELHLVHVYDEPFAYTDEDSDVPPADLKAEHERWERVQPAVPGVVCKRAFIVGQPVGTLLEYARSNDIDLIVMGTHGRTGLTRLLMGSVAEAVLRRATCPVLTIKQPAESVPENSSATMR